MSQPDAPRWRRYLRFWEPDIAGDVEDELEFHIRERMDALIVRGMNPREARDEVMRTVGDIERIKRTCRAIAQQQEVTMRRADVFRELRQDLVFAIRLLRTHPTLTAAIVLTLSLGIGATSSIFSVVNAVLLRPLPYADDDRLVMVWEQLNGGDGAASVGHYHDWLEQTESFSALAARQGSTFNLTDGEPERVSGGRVTPSYFQVLEMRPALGRYFREDETEGSRVVVLSHALWQTRFAADSSIIDRSIVLDGERHTVIGVTPPGFGVSEFSPQLYTPLTFTPEERANYGAHFLMVFGELRPGVGLDQAQRDLERVTEDIRRRHPDQMVNRGVLVRSYTDALVADYRMQLWVLLTAVLLVLLIGCGNVASLLLARAAVRRKEIAIRSALGSGRGRLVRQLLTESLLLAGVGGVGGVLLAHFGIRFIVETGPQSVPRLTEAALDARVLGFALMATVACGVLFGLAPALRATRVEPQSELREGGRGSLAVVRDRLRSALIVTEIAVALVLLVSAGLLLRSAERMQGVPIGFEPNGVTMLRIALPVGRYDEARAVESTFARIVEQVRTIPGVQSAAASTNVPMWDRSIDMGITVDGRARDPNRVQLGHVRLVTDGYIETLGMTATRGRSLARSDLRAGAPWVIVVNETFARDIFGEENPLGRRIFGWTDPSNPEWREIVGVVADVHSFGLESEAPPEIYIPMTQAPQDAWPAFQRSMAIIARSTGTPITGGALRAAVNEIDPSLPLFDVQTMNDVLQQSTATRRFNTLLLSGLGLTGLILAAIGIYGVIAFFVSQRSHEIGVRVALGATARDVVRLVVTQAVILALLGIAIGSTAAYWAMQALRGMLFEVGARDPVTFTAAAIVLLLIALAAATLPARRAARVDPVKALASG